MKKELPVMLPHNFKATFFYALPIACIMADPDYHDWYYMNYMDFYGYKNNANKEKYEFRYVDAISYVDRILHKNEAVQIDKYDLSYFSCEDIIGFVKDRIETWNYIIFYVDESKIPSSPFSKGLHEYLIYGYDDENESLKMLGMNKNRGFAIFEYSYDIIKVAYKSMTENFSHGRILYQMCVTNRYTSLPNGENRYYSHHIKRNYDEEIFVNKLRAFLDGKITEGPVEVINKAINPQIECGIKTIEIFKRYFKEVQEKENDFEFNVPFFLLGYRNGIYERLGYAYKKTQKPVYKRVMECYIEIVNRTELIRNLHIKSIQKEKYDMRKITDLLDKTTEQEWRLLSEI